MALSASARSELRQELIALRKERQHVEKKITAILAILEDATPQDAPGDVHELPELPGLETSHRPASLHRAILNAMGRKGRPVKPKEITGLLRSEAFPSEGKTPLETRVRNEMWRMSESNIIAKNRTGHYMLRSSEPQKPATSGGDAT